MNFKEGLDFDNVLIVPQLHNNTEFNSRSQISLISNSYFLNCVPVIASNMAVTGTFEVARVLSKHKMITALNKYYTLEDFKNNFSKDLNIIVSVGLNNNDEFFRIMEYYGDDIRWINLDVANGYMRKFRFFVKDIKKMYPKHIIIAGNVATPEGARTLVDYGADIVKVGIGNGSVCMTRHMTGCGYPQLQAIIECTGTDEDVYKIPVISDGGHKTPGDLVKAFVAGAVGVMTSSLFAGTKETGNMLYGMSSHYAQKKFNSYGKYKASEGKVVQNISNFLGENLEDVCCQILGGLASGVSYCGETDLNDIIGRRNFIVSRSQIYNNFWNK